MNNAFLPFPDLYNAEPSSPLMTIAEMADYLEIGKNRAYNLLRTGTIKGFRIGNSWKVTKEAIDLFIRTESGLI